MMLVVSGVILVILLTVFALAWNPWAAGNEVAPGQGGDDGQPQQEQPVEPAPGQQLMPQEPAQPPLPVEPSR